MTLDDRAFLKAFFQQTNDQPLTPDDRRYVPLYENPDIAGFDPVESLTRTIEWTSGESVQLLSGFRGTGKSTELRRLKKRLDQSNYIVLLCDIEDYLNLSTPVDVSDFLLAISGAFGEEFDRELNTRNLYRGSLVEERWAERLSGLIKGIRLEESEVGVASLGVSAKMKLNLRNDPSFKRRVQLPAFKLRDQSGIHLEDNYSAIEKVVERRGEWQKLLPSRDSLHRLIRYSGGHLRDLLRLVAEVLRRAETLPVPSSTVQSAIDQLRTEFLPIADDDARWLFEIGKSHRPALNNIDDLPTLARFLDTHLALCYRNGEEWYDVHPLIAENVKQQALEKTRNDPL